MPPGRPRCPRRIEAEPNVTYFKPRGIPLKDLEVVVLTPEELEIVRLLDLNGLDQEGAARKMGISRRVLWEDLQSIRKKIAEALVEGKAIEINGGNFVLAKNPRYTCNGCHMEWRVADGAEDPKRCPECGHDQISRCPDEGESKMEGGCCHGDKGRCRRESQTD